MATRSYNLSISAAYGAATELNLTMAPNVQYRLFVTTAAWFRVTTAGGAAAAVSGAGSHPIAANTEVLVAALGQRNRISVIQDTAPGVATLSEVAAGS